MKGSLGKHPVPGWLHEWWVFRAEERALARRWREEGPKSWEATAHLKKEVLVFALKEGALVGFLSRVKGSSVGNELHVGRSVKRLGKM